MTRDQRIRRALFAVTAAIRGLIVELEEAPCDPALVAIVESLTDSANLIRDWRAEQVEAGAASRGPGRPKTRKRLLS